MSGQFGLEGAHRVVMRLQLRGVTLPELGPFRRLMAEPMAQRIARRQVFDPGVDVRLVLAQPTRPEPVDEHAKAVAFAGRFVNALDSERCGHGAFRMMPLLGSLRNAGTATPNRLSHRTEREKRMRISSARAHFGRSPKSKAPSDTGCEPARIVILFTFTPEF
ncbi:hypothetical protein GALL_406990 [mine drainage metagenome]|uniref:Uncharacterized protein n=1 Tax=mine drainage metagenome TaxID=410659 RepID=A0A1J5QCG3_9ZZZZ